MLYFFLIEIAAFREMVYQKNFYWKIFWMTLYNRKRLPMLYIKNKIYPNFSIEV